MYICHIKGIKVFTLIRLQFNLHSNLYVVRYQNLPLRHLTAYGNINSSLFVFALHNIEMYIIANSDIYDNNIRSGTVR